jgi:hypothetical protein
VAQYRRDKIDKKISETLKVFFFYTWRSLRCGVLTKGFVSVFIVNNRLKLNLKMVNAVVQKTVFFVFFSEFFKALRI